MTQSRLVLCDFGLSRQTALSGGGGSGGPASGYGTLAPGVGDAYYAEVAGATMALALPAGLATGALDLRRTLPAPAQLETGTQSADMAEMAETVDPAAAASAWAAVLAVARASLDPQPARRPSAEQAVAMLQPELAAVT